MMINAGAIERKYKLENVGLWFLCRVEVVCTGAVVTSKAPDKDKEEGFCNVHSVSKGIYL